MKKYAKAIPGKGIVASRVVGSVEDRSRYRCVRSGSDPMKFQPYELGIHCGSLEQAQYFKDNKYGGSGDIYKVTFEPSCVLSNVVDDFEAWNSVEAVYEILSTGFDVDISKKQVIQDFRDGLFDKNDAASYIKEIVGKQKLVVVYHNSVELNEQDVIVLDDTCILDTKLI